MKKKTKKNPKKKADRTFNEFSFFLPWSMLKEQLKKASTTK